MVGVGPLGVGVLVGVGVKDPGVEVGWLAPAPFQKMQTGLAGNFVGWRVGEAFGGIGVFVG